MKINRCQYLFDAMFLYPVCSSSVYILHVFAHFLFLAQRPSEVAWIIKIERLSSWNNNEIITLIMIIISDRVIRMTQNLYKNTWQIQIQTHICRNVNLKTKSNLFCKGNCSLKYIFVISVCRRKQIVKGHKHFFKSMKTTICLPAS